MAVERTDGQLRRIEAALIRLEERMRALCEELPAPEFEDGTDRPLNPSAEIYGLLTATLEDEIRSAVATLRRAVSISSRLERPERGLQEAP